MLNKVFLNGRLTGDPDTKYTPQGVAVTRFSLAVQRSYVKQGEERQTDFINCTAFRSTAEFIHKWFKKGSAMILVGSLQTRSWEDKDGNKKFATDVIADEVYFGDSKTKKPDEESQYLYDERKGIEQSDTISDDGFEMIEDKDLPF